jgi:hypothetical protein
MKLHNKELHNLCSLSVIVKAVKRRMMTHQMVRRTPERNNNLTELAASRKIIKWTLKIKCNRPGRNSFKISISF